MAAEYTLAQLAAQCGAELKGDPDQLIRTIAPLEQAGDGAISFIASRSYAKYLQQSKASALILNAELATDFQGNHLVVANPYLAYAQISALFDTAPASVAGINPSAQIADCVQLGNGVSIAANCVIEAGVILGDGVSLGAGCFIGQGSMLGDNCKLAPNVTVYHGVEIGHSVQILSASVIGADGFGFAPSADGWVKIHQIGGVRIGNKVHIGACTAIDRGALDDTIIEDGVIIDNQVQVAHNVQIGKNTALAGCVGIAGSAKIGANCTLGGGVGVAGHLQIADNVHLTGMTLVSKSIKEAGMYSSGTALSRSEQWRKNAVRFLHLDKLHKKVQALEAQIARLSDGAEQDNKGS